ncbi:MAG TPA: hypothetical protein ENF20_01540 [Candidatus Marinimicrobia bacterium]|nr:hypothetical protein [Candidatus Neomarinimicrobiota bacterium]
MPDNTEYEATPYVDWLTMFFTKVGMILLGGALVITVLVAIYCINYQPDKKIATEVYMEIIAIFLFLTIIIASLMFNKNRLRRKKGESQCNRKRES